MSYFERWVDIVGFEGLYQVSDKGRVRSCDRYLRASYDSKQFRRGQIIKPSLTPNGYLVVGLHQDNKTKISYVHRLVATAFVENTNGYKEVNHKDENKQNNAADNLEWCSHKYNINYGSTREKISKSHAENGYGKIPIVQMKNGRIVDVFDSAADAERSTGICASSIRKCCLKRPKFLSAGGYEWSNFK